MCSPVSGACPTGQYQSKAATATSDRVCTDVSQSCPAGQYQAAEATATSDIECQPISTELCPVGTFRTGGSATSNSVCQPVTTEDCPAGQYQSKVATATADRVCSPVSGACPTGQYQSKAATANSDRECSPVSECPADQYEVTAATATSDAVCGNRPEAKDFTLTVAEDTKEPAVVTVFDNSKLPENESITGFVASSTFNTENAESINYSSEGGVGKIGYVPKADFSGTDTFTYVIENKDGITAEGTISVDITAVNDAPVAEDVAITFPANGPKRNIATEILAKVIDPDNTDLKITEVVKVETKGYLKRDSDTGVTYDPNNKFNDLEKSNTAVETFTYTVSDGEATATANGAITIVGVKEVAAKKSEETLSALACSTTADCSGNGVCSSGKCLCQSGFSGEKCEIKSCPNDCSGNGQCNDGTCQCKDGWTGNDCSTKQNTATLGATGATITPTTTTDTKTVKKVLSIKPEKTEYTMGTDSEIVFTATLSCPEKTQYECSASECADSAAECPGPTSGSFSVSPSTVKSFGKVSVSASGWQNRPNRAGALQYKWSYNCGESQDVLLRSYSTSNQYDFTAPATDNTDGKTCNITLSVQDERGAVTTQSQVLKIMPPESMIKNDRDALKKVLESTQLKLNGDS